MSNAPADEKPLALVIEDDPRQADIFAQALQLADYETEVISEGQSAVTRLAEVAPALVVLDLQLPGLSGEKVLHAIRAAPHLTDTRVIVATAHDRRADPVRRESDLVLLKPISFTQLRDLAVRLRPGN